MTTPTPSDQYQGDKIFNFGFGPGGGIGDMIVSLPVLDHILEHVGPHAEIHVLDVKNTETYHAIVGARPVHIHAGNHDIEYHGFICANELCNFTIDGQNKKIITMNEDLVDRTPEFFDLLRKGLERISLFGPMATHLPFINNGLANLAVKLGLNRVTLPQWSIGMNEFKYPRLRAKVPSIPLPERYITFNDGWQSNQPKPTKSYDQWQTVIDASPLPVVQIGNTQTGKPYSNCIQLKGQLPFSESLSVLANSACHIDIEGGLVHAAHALGTPSVVLHGPTNVQFFGYPANQNLLTGTCQNCWWLTPEWNANCVAHTQTCMNHRPEIIAEAVNNVLDTVRIGV